MRKIDFCYLFQLLTSLCRDFLSYIYIVEFKGFFHPFLLK
nr:MAG TPA: hypothetical protein [Caudoviricetes sp.]